MADDAQTQAIKSTPTGMAPAGSNNVLVYHAGYQTVLEAAAPLAREEAGFVDHTDDPLGHRDFRTTFGKLVQGYLLHGDTP